eukprot:6420718-Prymnesium_polylepis.1
MMRKSGNPERTSSVTSVGEGCIVMLGSGAVSAIGGLATSNWEDLLHTELVLTGDSAMLRPTNSFTADDAIDRERVERPVRSIGHYDRASLVAGGECEAVPARASITRRASAS